MNEKQKAFADYYIETLNATEAAKRAGYSEKTAEVQGCRLLNNAKIKAYIKERLESKDAARVASQDEVLQFLTQVMRGEVKDQLGLETPVKERNRAAELLGKRYAIFNDNLKIDGTVPVKIVDDL
jgi:phage terminase small subunit